MTTRDDSSTRAGSAADRSRVSSVAEQIHSSYLRASLLRQAEEKKARKVRFYRNGDRFYRGAVYAVSPERFRSFDSLLAELTKSPICDPKLMPNGVRYIFSLDGTRKILSLDELAEGESYVCATLDVFKDIDYSKSFDPAAWHQSGRGARPGAATMGQPSAELPPLPGPPRRPTPTVPGSAGGGDPLAGGDAAAAMDEATFVEQIRPRLITVVRAGPRPRMSVRIPLNKRTARSLEQVLRGISDIVRLDSGAVKRMYTLGGKQVLCLADFFLEDTIFLACGSERPVYEDFQLDANEVRLVCAYRFSAGARNDRITLRSQSSSRARPLNQADASFVDPYPPHVRSQPASPMAFRRQLKTAAADVRPRRLQRTDAEGSRASSRDSEGRSTAVRDSTRQSDDRSRASSGRSANRSASLATSDAGGEEVMGGDGDAFRTGASSTGDSDRYYDEGGESSSSRDVQSGIGYFEVDISQSPRTDEDGESLPLEDARDADAETTIVSQRTKGSVESDAATPPASIAIPSEQEPPRPHAEGVEAAERSAARLPQQQQQRPLANGHVARGEARDRADDLRDVRTESAEDGPVHPPRTAANTLQLEQTGLDSAANVIDSENAEKQQQQRIVPADSSAQTSILAAPGGSQTSLKGEAEICAADEEPGSHGSRNSLDTGKLSPSSRSLAASKERLSNHPDADADDEMISTRYEILRVIAKEDPVTIKECISRDSGRHLALKMVDKSRCEPEELRAVTNEVSLLRDVKHANIIGLVEGVETSRAWHLVMDLDEGSDVASALSSALAYSEADAGRLFRDLLSALKHLHSQSIVHCNVTLDNLLVVGVPSSSESTADTNADASWRLKLGGFSNAALIKTASSELTSTAEENHPDADPSPTAPGARDKEYEQDLRGAGLILWTLLTGNAPPKGDKLEVEDCLREAKRSGVSRDALDLVAGLLGVNESRQISTADEALLHPWLVNLSSTDQISAEYHQDRSALVSQKVKASFRQKPKYSSKATAISILMGSRSETRIKDQAEKSITSETSNIDLQANAGGEMNLDEQHEAVSGESSQKYRDPVKPARTSSELSVSSQLTDVKGSTVIDSGEIQDASTTSSLPIRAGSARSGTGQFVSTDNESLSVSATASGDIPHASTTKSTPSRSGSANSHSSQLVNTDGQRNAVAVINSSDIQEGSTVMNSQGRTSSEHSLTNHRRDAHDKPSTTAAIHSTDAQSGRVADDVLRRPSSAYTHTSQFNDTRDEPAAIATIYSPNVKSGRAADDVLRRPSSAYTHTSQFNDTHDEPAATVTIYSPNVQNGRAADDMLGRTSSAHSSTSQFNNANGGPSTTAAPYSKDIQNGSGPDYIPTKTGSAHSLTIQFSSVDGKPSATDAIHNKEDQDASTAGHLSARTSSIGSRTSQPSGVNVEQAAITATYSKDVENSSTAEQLPARTGSAHSGVGQFIGTRINGSNGQDEESTEKAHGGSSASNAQQQASVDLITVQATDESAGSATQQPLPYSSASGDDFSGNEYY